MKTNITSAPILVLISTAVLLDGCATTNVKPVRAVATPFVLSEDNVAEAPFGTAFSANIVNYNRVAPHVATAGVLKEDSIAQAKQLGFKLIVDLRQPDEEGVDEEKLLAEQIGVRYMHLPLASDETVWRQIEVIESILTDSANYPVLIHCGSANRAAAAWTLYRTRNGVDAVTAIEEGRAAGLKSRERFVRELLGLTTAGSEQT